MTTKVVDILRAALGHLRVIDAHEALDAVQSRDGIIALNGMMNTWEAEGLPMGWSDVDQPTDDMPTPHEADEAIGYNLAVRLRAAYNASLDPDVVALANSGRSMLQAQVTSSTFVRMCYPDLPCPSSRRFGGWHEGNNS